MPYYIKNGQTIFVENPKLNPDLVSGATEVAAPTQNTDYSKITSVNPASTPVLSVTQPADTPVFDISKIDTTPIATEPSSAETNVSDLIKQITDMQNTILGESAFTAEQQKAQGIPDITAKQNDLIAQIEAYKTQSAALENQKQLAEERIMQESEGRGRTAGGIAPLTASAQRKITLQQADIASQALTTQASLYAIQGKLATANMLVEQAVSAKFGAQKEKLKADIANLEILLKDPALDKAIKDRAAAQLAIKEKQDAEIKKAEKSFEEAQKKALEYSGVADSVTLGEMNKCKDAVCVAQIARKNGLKTLEEQKAEKELAQFGESADIKEFRAFYPNVDITTPQGRQAFLNFQAKKAAVRREPVIGEPAISPYQKERATRNLQSANELRITALNNPGIFGKTAALPLPDWMRSEAFRNFSSELNTLKANIAFGELTAMREASKTGGALGQVSDKEGQLLQDSLGALSMTQSPQNFVKQLEKIQASIIRWRNAVNEYSTPNVVTAPDGTQVEIVD